MWVGWRVLPYISVKPWALGFADTAGQLLAGCRLESCRLHTPAYAHAAYTPVCQAVRRGSICCSLWTASFRTRGGLTHTRPLATCLLWLVPGYRACCSLLAATLLPASG